MCRITIRPLSTVPGHIQSIRRTIGVTPDISAQGLSGPASHLAPAGPSEIGRRAETGGAGASIGTNRTSTSIVRGLTRSVATIGSTGRNTARASDTTTATCGRSSVTTICAAVRKIAWTSAARVASKSSGPGAIDRVRDKDRAPDKSLANGRVRGNGLRGAGRARDSGRPAARPAPSGLRAERLLQSGLQAAAAVATHLATLAPEEPLNVIPRA